jgi:hypothetical protein
VRAVQVATYYPAGNTPQKARAPAQIGTISGSPPMLRLPLGTIGLIGAFGLDKQDFTDQVHVQYVHAFVGAGHGPGTPAHQAVQAALLDRAGLPFALQPRELAFYGPSAPGVPTGHGSLSGPGPAAGPVYAAAHRLAALSPAARYAWLAAHLAALRSSKLTLAALSPAALSRDARP